MEPKESPLPRKRIVCTSRLRMSVVKGAHPIATALTRVELQWKLTLHQSLRRLSGHPNHQKGSEVDFLLRHLHLLKSRSNQASRKVILRRKRKKKNVRKTLLGQFRSVLRLSSRQSPPIHQGVATTLSVNIVIITENTIQNVEVQQKKERKRGSAREIIEEEVAGEANTSAYIASWTILLFVFIDVPQPVSGKATDPLLAKGRAEDGEMFREGTEYSLDSPAQWESLILSRGEIVEIHLPSTSLSLAPDIWAGFWVKEATIEGDGGEYGFVAKSLGCSDPEWAKRLSSLFNRRVGVIHLCNHGFCEVEENFAMHATRLRVFSVEGFERPYLSSYVKRQIARWEKEDPEEAEDADAEGSGHARGDAPAEDGEEGEPPAEKEHGKKKPDKKPRASVDRGEPKEKKKDKSKTLTEEEKTRLRKRLEEARAKMVKIKPAGTAPEKEAREEEEEEKEPADPPSSPEYSPSVGFVEEPPGLEVPAIKDKRQVTLKEDAKRKGKKAKRKEAPEEDLSSSEMRKRKVRKKRQVEASKDTTTASWQIQLVRKAEEIAEAKREKAREDKRRKQKRNPGLQLAKILTRWANGGGRDPGKRGEPSPPDDPYGMFKKEHKGKKKKSQKKKKRTGMDPSSSPGSSTNENSGSSFNDDSEEDSSGNEAKRLEAPLKRKSKERPGSVLAMLLEHARSKLDQTAKVSVESAPQGSVTRGIKMSSYFAIIVRGQVGSSMAQARELHHLAQVIDLLRQGDLDVMGDVLAARFISIHQSVIDGSWATARHLEMLPLEDGTAAGPEIILNARKQAKLAAKLSPGDSWTWSAGQKGRGAGGRGKGSQWYDYGQESKGKGKKGGKGKGKQKGWPNQEKDMDGRTREKIPEK